MKMLSVVVPVYNEEKGLPVFVGTVLPLMRKTGLAGELILVNDGSRDASLLIMTELCALHPEVKVVDLSRNFGKEYALTAGMQFAKGDAVVVMDADLQHPPELIPAFLEKWYEGYDIVYGVHYQRQEESRLKKAMSGLFYRLFNRVTDVPLPRNVGDFLLMDRQVVDALNTLPERNRFMKGLFAWVGFRRIGVPYQQVLRAFGSSKWSLWKLWNFALDGLTSFTTLPLRLWSYIGLGVSLLAILYASYLVIRTLVLGVDVPGFATIIVVVLILGGIQLVSLGVIGEYLGRLYHETKQRPLYLVRRTYGFGQDNAEPGQSRPENSDLRPMPSTASPKHPEAGKDIGEYGHQQDDK